MPTYPLSRADSGGSVSSQERFRVGAFAGAGAGAELPSLEEELAQEPLLQLLPRPRPASTISLQSGEVSNGWTFSHQEWFSCHVTNAVDVKAITMRLAHVLQVSNTSAGTDTDTQFLMSSDSGSKVQVSHMEKIKLP